MASGMSSGKCPNCKKKAMDDLSKHYGEISQEAFIDLINDNATFFTMESEPMIEEWKIGIYENEFVIEYSARCEVCGFEKSYEKKENLIL